MRLTQLPVLFLEYGHISHYKTFEYGKIFISSLKTLDVVLLLYMLLLTSPGGKSIF